MIVEQTSKIEAIHADGSMDDFDIYGLRDAIDPLREAITELRRRGDTLVRRDDLRKIVDGKPLWYAIEAQHGREYTDEPECRDDPPVLVGVEPDAIRRLEIALGGKLR